ncbi:MerR family transcriptional regulator [Actinoplanes sp. NPDC023936]|uniref:MerR family transcriptional regulator n=1 Tax=Actinoplanes sp. NPDC023936 TaxID=3154910 RepID=UPI0033D7A3DD
MLTIGELAAYAGVTVRAVRHYHQVGLLPEPKRDASGYRRYGATAVVSLIKIRTLADAGVPLAQIRPMLAADPAGFAEAVRRIDRRVSDEIQRLETIRKQIAQLTSGDSAALPSAVTYYLDRLREIGASEAMVRAERDGWILITARWPDRVVEWIPGKLAQLEDPRVVRLYRILSTLIDGAAAGDETAVARPDETAVARPDETAVARPDETAVARPDETAVALMEEAADIMAALSEEAEEAGDVLSPEDKQDNLPFDLLDALADEAHPGAQIMRDLMRKRGWYSWTRSERVPEPPA